jgi:hypothetical protein
MPHSSKVLSEDACSFYFNCPVVTVDSRLLHGTTDDHALRTMEPSHLRREGFTHVLLCSPVMTGDTLAFRSPLEEAIRTAICQRSQNVVLLTEYDHTDSVGRCFHYQLVMLTP